MSLSKRNDIINSYSNVLVEILSNDNNKEEILVEIKEKLLKSGITKLSVNPVNVREYNKIGELLKQKVGNDELQKFFYTIFKRRFCFLLEDIVLEAEKKLSKELNYSNVYVFSKNELNDIMKQNILKIVSENSKKKVNVIYDTNASLGTDDIEIRTNNKICVINTQSIIKQILG